MTSFLDNVAYYFLVLLNLILKSSVYCTLLYFIALVINTNKRTLLYKMLNNLSNFSKIYTYLACFNFKHFPIFYFQWFLIRPTFLKYSNRGLNKHFFLNETLDNQRQTKWGSFSINSYNCFLIDLL